MLYEDAQGMVEYVSQGLRDAAKEAAILLYSPGTDTFLEDMTKNADRVFYFDEGQVKFGQFGKISTTNPGTILRDWLKAAKITCTYMSIPFD